MITFSIVLFIALVLLLLKYAWWYPSEDLKKTRIIMYHMITNQLPQTKKSGLRVSPEMFESHLQYFTDNNWKFIKMSQIYDYKDSEKVVAITFDDGYLDNYINAFPLLKKYNACATLYLVIDRHDNDWSIKKNIKHNTGALVKEGKLSDTQIHEMIHSDIFELGGHTISHPYLPNLSNREKEREINDCKEMLEDIFRTKVSSFAYPFGIYSKADVDIVKKSKYESSVTTNEGVANNNDSFELKRIKASGKDSLYLFKLRVMKGFRGFI